MKHKLGLYFWLHVLVVLFIWSSPFYLDWRIILILIGLYYLQLFIFGDCLLIKGQFKTKSREMTIYIQVAENLGFKVNRQKMVFISDYILPWVILIAAIIYQVVF